MPDENTPQDAVSPSAWLGGAEPRQDAPEAPQKPGTGLLTAAAIMQAPDLATVDVEVPEWGGTVRVRALNGRERDAFEASCMKERRDGTTEFVTRNMRAKLVALCLVDEKGQRLFGEEDIAALGKKAAKPLAQVFDAATKLNGLSGEDVKSLEGNSDGPGDGFSSASPWPSDEQ